MKKPIEIAPDAFERMLAWLNPDRDAAGQKYEEVRRRLVRLFVYRGCSNAEELADLVFDRVSEKIDETVERFVGDPLRHFLAVANFIYLESRKKPVIVELPESIGTIEAEPDDDDPRFDCLAECLATLTTDRRRMVIEYYLLDKRAKIERRQQLAEKLGITLANLHSKMFRLRSTLQQCVEKCVVRV